MLKTRFTDVRAMFVLMTGVAWLCLADVALAYESSFAQVNVAGSFNGWDANTQNMSLVDDYVWQGDFAIGATEFEFKFTTPNFQDNWGLNTQPHQTLPLAGAALAGQGNMRITKPATLNTIRFIFNDQTRRFSVFALNALETNLLYNGSFEMPGTETTRARYWESGNPNVHGAAVGSVQRGGWDPPTPPPNGEWFGAILGTWSEDGDVGSWWQEASVQPGATYEASGHFFAEGAPNTWTSVVQELRLEFYDFNGEPVGDVEAVSLMDVGAAWQTQAVSAKAPAGAAWGRVVIYSAGNGPSGTFLLDEVQLKAIGTSREQDFDEWFGADVDGAYLFGGWTMEDGLSTGAPLSRSGLAASLSNPDVVAEGGYVKSPRLENGIGLIRFYYRHGFEGDPDVGADEPVSMRVQTSELGDFWTTVATLDNIYTTDYVLFEVPVVDYFSRYVRIQHSGGSTNRLLIDDWEIARPETLEVSRLMNFDTWPAAGESYACHPAFQGWVLCTGKVSTAFARDGYSAHLPGADGDPNYLESPEFDNGYGAISFNYRRGTNGINTVGLSLEVSSNGTEWVVLETIEGIFETSWQTYSRFFYETVPHAIRIRNIEESVEAGGSSVLLDEPFNGGSQAPSGWTFSQIGQYTTTASSGEDPPSIAFNKNGSFVITPAFANATNVQFMIKGQSISATSQFVVQGLIGASWQTLTSYTGISNGKVTRSLNLATNVTALRFQYNKASGNLAFDDLIITGETPAGVQPPQVLMLDDVLIGNPAEYRRQNFDSWPRKGSYAGDSEHQYWTITGDHIVDPNNAFEGNVARLRRPSAGPNPIIMSHYFGGGVGAIDFQYRAWPNDAGVGFVVQVSSNGTTWATVETVTGVPNTQYTAFSADVNNSDLHYVRIMQNAGNNNTRLLVDDILISRPLPPANLLLSGGHLPERPFSDDEVTLFAQAIPINGAQVLQVQAFYRVGDSGPYSTNQMNLVGGLWQTETPIPMQPSGTLVQYYIEASFSGPGGQSGTVFYPEAGVTAPADYQIPRNRPGSVWINEIDYVNWSTDWFEFENGEFVELAGVAGADLSDWQIIIENASTLPLEEIGHYTIVSNTVLLDVENGYGFFVLAGDALAPVPPDPQMTMTNFLSDISIGGVRLLNELGQLESMLSFGGRAPIYEQIDAVDLDDDADWFEPFTNSVGLVGVGTEASHFDWGESHPPTPGAVNPGQTFGEPAALVFAPESLLFEYIAGSLPPVPQDLVISNAGASALSYTLTPDVSWISVDPVSGSDINPEQFVTHSVSVNTSNRIGNYSGIISVSGAFPDSPIEVPVSLTEVQIDNALLRYAFDQGSGGSALNSGTVGPSGNLAFSGNAGWTLNAGGVSSAGGDYGVQFNDDTAYLNSAAAISELNQLDQLTIAGWMRTDLGQEDRLLVGNRASGQGFELLIASNSTRLAFVSANGASPQPVYSDAGVFGDNEWTFFALTYDATAAGTDAVQFFMGSLSNDVALLSAHGVADLAGTGMSSAPVSVGGNGVEAFVGLLDDVRVYDSKLDPMTLQGIRNISVKRRENAGDTVPPTISEQPSSQLVNIDQPVSFNVTASGDPLPVYQWRFNGEDIPGANNSSYFIANAQPAQMGQYDVVVQNIYGSVVSRTVSLWVNHPPAFMSAPTTRHVYIGDDASLSIGLNGYPPPRNYWYRDGDFIGSSTSTNWPIPSAVLADAGDYYVVASNFMGMATSGTGFVRVLDDQNNIPFPADDAFRPTPGGNGVVIRWNSAEGRVFDLYWATDLTDGLAGFNPIATGITSTPPLNVHTQLVDEAKGYYFIDIREP
jgi:hypothetical protein